MYIFSPLNKLKKNNKTKQSRMFWHFWATQSAAILHNFITNPRSTLYSNSTFKGATHLCELTGFCALILHFFQLVMWHWCCNWCCDSLVPISVNQEEQEFRLMVSKRTTCPVSVPWLMATHTRGYSCSGTTSISNTFRGLGRGKSKCCSGRRGERTKSSVFVFDTFVFTVQECRGAVLNWP